MGCGRLLCRRGLVLGRGLRLGHGLLLRPDHRLLRGWDRLLCGSERLLRGGDRLLGGGGDLLGTGRWLHRRGLRGHRGTHRRFTDIRTRLDRHGIPHLTQRFGRGPDTYPDFGIRGDRGGVERIDLDRAALHIDPGLDRRRNRGGLLDRGLRPERHIR